MEMLDTLKKIFQIIPNKSVGICHDAHRLLAVYLERDGEAWRLSAADELQLMEDGETMEERIVVSLRLHCAKKGWNTEHSSICLSGEDLFSGRAELPELGSAAELAEAVRWEVESRDVFGDEDFRSVSWREEVGESAYWIAAVGEKKAAAWENAWREEMDGNVLLTVMPPLKDSLYCGESGLSFAGSGIAAGNGAGKISAEFLPALYAAMLPAGLLGDRYRIRLPQREIEEVWNWKRIGVGMACTIMLVLGMSAGFDLWQLREAKAALQETRRELVLLDAARQKKARIEHMREQVKKRDAGLERLSRESFPWHSLLVHFGCMTVEGVFISDIHLEKENTLDIRGEAVTFDALAEFLKTFEEDRDFFPSGPVLQSSSRSGNQMPGETVRFTLQLDI